jgi:hypothetical protein
MESLYLEACSSLCGREVFRRLWNPKVCYRSQDHTTRLYHEPVRSSADLHVRFLHFSIFFLIYVWVCQLVSGRHVLLISQLK